MHGVMVMTFDHNNQQADTPNTSFSLHDNTLGHVPVDWLGSKVKTMHGNMHPSILVLSSSLSQCGHIQYTYQH